MDKFRLLAWLRAMIMPFTLLFLIVLAAMEGKCQEINISTVQMLEIINQGKQDMADIELKFSDEVYLYKEERRLPQGHMRLIVARDKEWKEIALRIVNLDTGETRDIKVAKIKGALSYASDMFTIDLEGRPSGPMWNGFNTSYLITKPPGWAVIVSKYRQYTQRGVSQDIIYSPYSAALHLPEFVDSGRKHHECDIFEAIEKIKYFDRPYRIFL